MRPLRPRVMIVRVFWRDNANPYPGRLTEVKRVTESRSECAWREYVRRLIAERNEREWAKWRSDATLLESLADQAMEGIA